MAEAGEDGKKGPEPNKNDETADWDDDYKEPVPESTTEFLMRLMRQGLQLQYPKPEKQLDSFDLDGIAHYILSGKCKNIITMAGAGISTSAGIPDFRSPGTGLYDNLQRFNLPSPQAIFDIDFFKENPEPFFQLAKELWPGLFKPTPCHYFIQLLAEKKLLRRHFTQNIDTLEHVAGIPEGKIVEAHGTFHTSHCQECHKAYTQDWIKEKIFDEVIPKCEEEECDGVVKPDIVFFGDPLPAKFFDGVATDLPACDLLIVLGTSLKVQPFASLVHRVSDTCPRLYINLEKPPGSSDPIMALLGMGHGFQFDTEENYRDVFWEGACDDGVYQLADKLGWGDDLRKLVQEEHARIEAESEKEKESDEKNKPAEGKKDAEGAGGNKDTAASNL